MSTPNYLVVTAIGQDHPGIVRSFTKTITEHDCNIEDSRMSILGGEFAMILLLSGHWNAIAKLETALARVGDSLALQISAKHTDQRQSQPSMLSYQVEVLSIDRPGIVHQTAEFFSRRQINIDNLSSDSYHAAHTGTPMFALTMMVNIPSDLSIADLRDQFLDFCDEMNMDGIIEPLRG
ncbi:MAG TPA: glycine cleavage system protein R [Candidatus Tenderia sp.]|nr:glycine cleavage system protein R [Candidatus Tenderia sp.]